MIASFPDDFFGYFGWPTVARMGDGTVVAAASGLRNGHECPFGRTVFMRSTDDGVSWTSPVVIHDSPLDDRDAGLLWLGGNRLLVSWFTTNASQVNGPAVEEGLVENTLARWREGYARAGQRSERWVGSWVSLSDDSGETWSEPIKVPVNAPHGPIRLATGELLYLGKEFVNDTADHEKGVGRIVALRSEDGGRSWQRSGVVPLIEGTEDRNYCEAHVAELPDGKLVGLMRMFEFHGTDILAGVGVGHFTLTYTESTDGAATWSRPEPMGFHGSPPHLLVHSNGTLVVSYGRRLPPFGQRIMISRDRGTTWSYDYVLRDDGPGGDLGYPSSVELADGRILTAYYQQPASTDDKCALLWSLWTLPSV